MGDRVTKVACLGGGLIGRSWAALFLAGGTSVTVYDPDPDVERRVHDSLDASWPSLQQLGLAQGDAPHDALTVVDDPVAAVVGARFVQESIPERVDLKHALYAAIEGSLDPAAIVASSASGLTLGELQGGWSDPARFVLGHPFNPPHLIPLVEVMGNERTADGVVAEARAFYESVGKVTIEVRKEVPGHVANRLQAALWREAYDLVARGAATVADVDAAITNGPGLRWAVVGPFAGQHLSGGDGGIAHTLEHLGPPMVAWWDDLATPSWTPDLVAQVTAQMADELGTTTSAELAAARDELVLGILAAKAHTDGLTT